MTNSSLPRFWLRVVRERLSMSTETWPYATGLLNRQLLDYMSDALVLVQELGPPPDSPTTDSELSPLPPST